MHHEGFCDLTLRRVKRRAATISINGGEVQRPSTVAPAVAPAAAGRDGDTVANPRDSDSDFRRSRGEVVCGNQIE